MTHHARFDTYEQELMRMRGRYLEDFAIGQTFGSSQLRISEEQIKAFAAEFDPQPFHLDNEAAQDTIFKGLAASGWHTAALTMRLLVESEIKPAASLALGSTNSVGHGLCGLAMKPHIESEVLEVRPWQSLPSRRSVDVG